VGKSFARFVGIGRRHDFKLYQASEVRFAPQTESLQDIGYQGIQKLHSNSRLPHKKPRGGQLTGAQKADNRALAQRRVVPIASQPLLENLPHLGRALPQPSSPLWLAL